MSGDTRFVRNVTRTAFVAGGRLIRPDGAAVEVPADDAGVIELLANGALRAARTTSTTTEGA